MTVLELMQMLMLADNMDADVYVDNSSENNPAQLEDVDVNEYSWGYVIGKVEME